MIDFEQYRPFVPGPLKISWWDSSTYRSIFNEGREQGLEFARGERALGGPIVGTKRMILLLGANRFGIPDAATVYAIEAIGDYDRLMELADRVYEPKYLDWADLLRDS